VQSMVALTENAAGFPVEQEQLACTRTWSVATSATATRAKDQMVVGNLRSRRQFWPSVSGQGALICSDLDSRSTIGCAGPLENMIPPVVIASAPMAMVIRQGLNRALSTQSRTIRLSRQCEARSSRGCGRPGPS